MAKSKIKKKTTQNKSNSVKKKTTQNKINTNKRTTTTKKVNFEQTTTLKPIKTKKINNTPNRKKSIKRKKNTKKDIIKKLTSFIIMIIIIYIFINKYLVAPTPVIKKVFIDENNYINVTFKTPKLGYRNEIYCLFKKDDKIPTITDNWILTSNNNCIQKLDDDSRYYVFLKNRDNKIIKVKDTENLGKILSIKTNKEKIYLPINGNETIKAEYESIGYINEKIKWTSENESIALVEDGKITGKSKGNTKIIASIGGVSSEINVIVTNLITTRPKGEYDYEKDYLPCNKYTEEDNNLIDEILKDRINEVGYKTRAGVVEAARFLTLDFPYRINYFYENGRQTTNNVDGEGRYYHTGMYLHSSRNKNITRSKKGPIIWGCSLYSVPAKRNINNGLDCSGFVSWALLNGGFDVKDVGAGWSNKSDLTDFGTVKKLNTSLATSSSLRVGDLLHSEKAGGHIGIIVGIDSDNYYVAQAIWYDTIGVIISKIKKSKLPNEFKHAVLMDNYYKKDGNLTNMW